MAHAITSELKEVESRRLTLLTPEEIAAIPRGTAVRLRMRLVRNLGNPQEGW